MSKEIVLHRYTECGLPNVWIQCFQDTDDAGEKVFTIPCIGNLHKEIARGIVTSNGALSGAELKFLRSEMGLTQTELGELVDRKRLTIARWEKGEGAPDGAAETLIRMLAVGKLELPGVETEEIIGKFLPGRQTRGRINIELMNSKRYRLAA